MRVIESEQIYRRKLLLLKLFEFLGPSRVSELIHNRYVSNHIRWCRSDDLAFNNVRFLINAIKLDAVSPYWIECRVLYSRSLFFKLGLECFSKNGYRDIRLAFGRSIFFFLVNVFRPVSSNCIITRISRDEHAGEVRL